MKKFENIKLLEFLVIFELIFENVNIGLNLGMTKRTFKMYFFKSSDVFRCFASEICTTTLHCEIASGKTASQSA